ncbi:MAG TPA: hypothetical protein VMB50_24145 [Myxococcales bacterium]|nr:hypothetical protein [Myxococcales bacterium]
MPSPRKRRKHGAADRVRHLVALDAKNVMDRLSARLTEMVSLFSRLRDRGPLLLTVHSWFPSATFSDLAQLEPTEQRAVNAFYEVLGELRWYLQYTEDMPLQLQRQVGLLHGKLQESYADLTAVIGVPGERPGFVDGEVVERRSAPGSLAPLPRRARR